jgi:hypothetical protein
VLIVGVGTSASELARDLAPHVNKLYASRKVCSQSAVYHRHRLREY